MLNKSESVNVREKAFEVVLKLSKNPLLRYFGSEISFNFLISQGLLNLVTQLETQSRGKSKTPQNSEGVVDEGLVSVHWSFYELVVEIAQPPPG